MFPKQIIRVRNIILIQSQVHFEATSGLTQTKEAAFLVRICLLFLCIHAPNWSIGVIVYNLRDEFLGSVTPAPEQKDFRTQSTSRKF